MDYRDFYGARKPQQYQDYHSLKKYLWLIILFLIFLFLAILIYLMFFYSPYKKDKKQLMISVGICGCVKQRAVYHLPVNSIMSELIRAAGGVNRRADLTKVNLTKHLMNDSVYHVPCKKKGAPLSPLPVFKRPKVKMKQAPMPEATADHINIFYGGLPHTFMLLQVYPDLNLITITHIPYYSSFLMEKQRLGDYFFLMGIEPTVYMIQNFLMEEIDFFFVQDRISFMDMIDFMGGMPVHVDSLFGKEYDLTTGQHRLSGYHSWEYIRFIDKRTRKTSLLLGSHMRLERQKLFMLSMYKFFRSMNIASQANNVRHVLKISQTNLKYENAKKLMEIGIKMKNPRLELLTMPGTPVYENDVLYWEPKLDTYIQKRSDLVKAYGG